MLHFLTALDMQASPPLTVIEGQVSKCSLFNLIHPGHNLKFALLPLPVGLVALRDYCFVAGWPSATLLNYLGLLHKALDA